MTNDKEIKEFQAFIVEEAKSKGKNPEDYAKELGKDGLKKAYQRFVAYKQKKTQKALHGTKLNYFKSLKHQCAEDEEIVYYKRGGQVDCGCKKKEDGGEIPKSENGWKANFQAAQAEKKATAKKNMNNYPDSTENGKKKYDPKTKKFVPVTAEDKKKWEKNNKDAKQGKGEGTPQRKCGGPIKKDACGAVAKFKAARCGSKMKKHQQGGSLNGILLCKKENNFQQLRKFARI